MTLHVNRADLSTEHTAAPVLQGLHLSSLQLKSFVIVLSTVCWVLHDFIDAGQVPSKLEPHQSLAEKFQNVRTGFGKIANWEPQDRPLALVLEYDTVEVVQLPGFEPACNTSSSRWRS